MIEVSSSRSGHKILKLDGRWMCSQYDPIGEANKWAKEQKDKLSLASNVFVLGLGAGYHASALRAIYPAKNFLIIENENELINHFYANFNLDSASLSIVCLNDVTLLYANVEVKNFLQRHYAVLMPPCFDEDRTSLFMQIREVLISRTLNGCRQLLELRQPLAKAFSRPLIPNHVFNAERWLSIKDLCAMSNPDCRFDFAIIMALRELVA